MKFSLLTRVALGVSLFVFMVLSAGPITAQNIISAKGGLVTHSEGAVFVNNEPLKFDPARPFHVQQSQVVRTEADGKAEIMVVPEGYLRIPPSSEVEVLTLSPDVAHVKLRSGSAVLDLLDVWDDESVSLRVRDALLQIQKGGLYQIDAVEGTPLVVKNHKGKALVAKDADEHKLKAKTELSLTESGEASNAKFTPAEDDLVFAWNMERSKVIEEQRAEALVAHKEGRKLRADQMLLLQGSPMWACRQLGGSSCGGGGMGGMGVGRGPGGIGGGGQQPRTGQSSRPAGGAPAGGGGGPGR